MNSWFVLQPNPSLFNSEIAFSREASQKWGMGKGEIGSVYGAQLLFATSLQQSNTSVIIWKLDSLLFLPDKTLRTEDWKGG